MASFHLCREGHYGNGNVVCGSEAVKPAFPGWPNLRRAESRRIDMTGDQSAATVAALVPGPVTVAGDSIVDVAREDPGASARQWNGGSNRCPVNRPSTKQKRPKVSVSMTRAKSGPTGGYGGRTSASANGARSGRTTATTAMRGTTSITINPGLGPIIGARTASPA